ncbi:hypothetical protein DFH09DRAFT_1083546 [Mycena vulgaris]|nr:hypothetical protein DFH09DRAFT_1083546 [Mycena vulgaris]
MHWIDQQLPLVSPVVPPAAKGRVKDGWSAPPKLRSLVDTRHKWKAADSGEAIWSPTLEAALLEGLAQYQPSVCKDTVLLGRFPQRNKFIAQYIWTTTGQRRTPKQIGSRLQQLRESPWREQRRFLDSLEGRPVAAHLTVAHLLFRDPKSTTTSFSYNSNSPSPAGNGKAHVGPANITMCIDILPDNSHDAPFNGVPRPWAESSNIIHVSRHPRRLASIDPTVTLASHAPVFAQSKFVVWTDQAVRTETTGPLAFFIDPHLPAHACVLHRTPLIPEYWNIILDSPGIKRDAFSVLDPTRYTIQHQVTRLEDDVVIFSATYFFRHQMGSGPPLSHHPTEMHCP